RIHLFAFVCAAFLIGAPASSALDLAPVNLVPPSIQGSATQGSTVGCSPGTWQPTPTSYTYSWQRDAADIPGAANAQYVLQAADTGHVITCQVVAYENSKPSLAPAVSIPPIVPTAAAPPGPPLETAPPVIHGQAVEGGVLTCSSGGWTAATDYSYSWQ